MFGWAVSVHITRVDTPEDLLVSPLHASLSYMYHCPCLPSKPSSSPPGAKLMPGSGWAWWGQDGHLSGLGLPLKLPTWPHNCLTLPGPADQPARRHQLPPLTVECELGRGAHGPELWALELPSRLGALVAALCLPLPSFPSSASTSCLCSASSGGSWGGRGSAW